MKLSKAGKNYIKSREGFHATVYADVGGLATIGYGHLVKGVTLTYISTAIGKQINYLDDVKLTKCQAGKLLDLDLEVFVTGVNNIRIIKQLELTQAMFDALVSFAFNLGLQSLRTSTLIKKLIRDDYEGASLEFLRWKFAGGQSVQGLLNRRIEEMNIFLTKDVVGDILIPRDLTRVKDREYMEQLIVKYRGELYDRG